MEEFAHYDDLLNSNDFVIADRTAVWKDPTYEALPLKPLVPFAIRTRSGILPELIVIDELNQDQWNTMAVDFHLAAKGASGGLVTSMIKSYPQFDHEDISAFLKNHMLMRGPEGRFLLRYYDSRVFLHLRRIFPAELLCKLYGDTVKTWTVRFNNGWITIPAPEGATEERGDWRVDEQQYELLNRVQIINEAFKEWKGVTKTPWKDLDQFERTALYLDKVIKVGMEDYHLGEGHRDIQEFAYHALAHGMEFYKHPYIQQILEDVMSGQSSYRFEMAAEMPEDDLRWKEVESLSRFHALNQEDPYIPV